jgi:ubiquinone/menaquinone biosynthesis C-methylase UbiE
MNEQQTQEQTGNHSSSTVTPDPLVYLDTFSASEFVKTYKRQSYKLLELKDGMHVLDVGCGPGDDAQAMAQFVGSSGGVVGVDNDQRMLTEARRRAVGKEVVVEFCLCDAHQLSFGDKVFDCCHAERIFQHLANPRQALTEMVRVTKTGGCIGVIEPDWETLVIDAVDRDTTRKIAHFICDQIVRNGWIGRQLPNLFRACGLTKIGVVASAMPLTDFVLADQLWGLRRNAERAGKAGIVSASDIAEWIEYLENAGKTNHFWGAVTGFAVSGQKP